ncbi:MAG: hypothetical protein A3A51_01115 [Candidatus Levybacteria bacterium RIFCSPLOWO2_01_FULL_39_10]|nr:MAG: hypothetical protein A3A51_01115 [Candidatus Levybacteria bacterium RIFCSPLOWO2_01_FULL_39_10]
MREFLSNVLDRQPKLPAEPVEDVGYRALSSLDAIQAGFPEEESRSDLSTSELAELAVRNLRLIEKTISPVVKDFFTRTHIIGMEFGSNLPNARFRNIEYHPYKGKLVVRNIDGEVEATITEGQLRANISLPNEYGKWVKSFANTSREQIVDKFREQIRGSLDVIAEPVSPLISSPQV